MKAIYRLLSMKEINAITSDQIYVEEAEIIVTPDDINSFEITDEITMAKGWKTMDELISAMKAETAAKAQDKSMEFKEENLWMSDVRLEFSDGTPVTSDNFPSTGVTVTLPYPSEEINFSNVKDYNIVITHLITMSNPYHKVGDIIEEKYEPTEDGLRLTIMSASPFMVAWDKKQSEPEPTEQPKPTEQPEPTESPEENDNGDDDETSDSDEDDNKSTTPGKTGDNMDSFMWIWITVLVLAAAGAGGFAFLKLRGKNKDGDKS